MTDDCDDNCREIYNPKQGDCDEDAIGDLCDMEPMEVECPKDIVTAECEDVTLGKVTIVDDDCAELIQTEDISNDAPDWYELGDTIITWQVENPSGAVSQCTQTITRIVANDYFVDDNAAGANDGSSWDDAFLSLHSALDIAEPGDVIWVKEGTYDEGPYPLRTGVEIYGGFAQYLTETCGSVEKRDVRGNVSIIEGNSAGICLESATDGHMDGFTVQHCNGTNGGAIQVTDDGIVFGNMLFTDNESPNGGVINNEGDTAFYDCEFTNNTSSNGGAIRNAGSIYCDTCVFTGNYGSNGGAVADGTGVFIDSIFEGNSSNNGGAMNNVEGEFGNCRFISNQSIDGGALAGTGGVFEDCVFMYNSAINGGGLHQADGRFNRCVFLYNYASTNGGAVAESTGVFVNCIVANNISDINGGGVSGGTTDFTNCTVANNYAGISGGGLAGDAIVKNSIIWGNSAGTWADQINGSALVSYSNIGGGWDGEGNIDANPLFRTTAKSNYELQSTSPCIDTADTSVAPEIDIFGTDRTAADMGAVEYFAVTWVCGDGVLETGESCDDGNTEDGDGCSATCEIEPSCEDEVQNQDETDLDCGGAICDGCDNGKSCMLHRDCRSGYCASDDLCREPPASCKDEEQNGDETDVDCGGSCPSCKTGQTCATDADCESYSCDAGTCAELPACNLFTATDLGEPGEWVTVRNNGCVKVQSGYPAWWDTRTMQLQPNDGTYPVPFEWSNTCSDAGGADIFSHDWDNRFIGPTSEECGTLISLNGSGDGNITLRYYGL